MTTSENFKVGAPVNYKSKVVTFLLGLVGLHYFYLGRIGAGILFIISLGGCGVWYVLDLLLIMFGNKEDKNGVPIGTRVLTAELAQKLAQEFNEKQAREAEENEKKISEELKQIKKYTENDLTFCFPEREDLVSKVMKDVADEIEDAIRSKAKTDVFKSLDYSEKVGTPILDALISEAKSSGVADLRNFGLERQIRVDSITSISEPKNWGKLLDQLSKDNPTEKSTPILPGATLRIKYKSYHNFKKDGDDEKYIIYVNTTGGKENITTFELHARFLHRYLSEMMKN